MPPTPNQPHRQKYIPLSLDDAAFLEAMVDQCEKLSTQEDILLQRLRMFIKCFDEPEEET